MGKTVKISFLADTQKLERAMKRVDKSLGLSKARQSLGVAAKKIAMVGAAGTAAFGAVSMKLISAGEAAGTADARIGQISKSMGLFGNQTDAVTNRLIKYAEQTARATGVDTNAIKQTQAKLLTFKDLAKTADKMGGNFDRATQAAVDMAAAGFGTAENNAVQLGKALQDPIKGINALNRSGVTFTAAEKERIATLVKSNRMSEAQNIVLQAVEKQVGGTAKATANWTDRIKVMGHQLLESLGKKTLPLLEWIGPKIESVIPKLIDFGDTAANWLKPKIAEFSNFLRDNVIPILKTAKDVISAFFTGITGGDTTKLNGDLQSVANTGRAVGTAFKVTVNVLKNLWTIIKPFVPALVQFGATIYVAVKAWQAYQAALRIAVAVQILWNAVSAMNPTTLIITAIGALIAAIAALWMRSKSFREFFTNLWDGIKKTVSTVIHGIKTTIETVVNAISRFWKSVWDGKIGGVIRAVWVGIKKAVQIYVNAVKAVITIFLDLITGKWGKAWNGIKNLFTNVWNGFKGIVSKAFGGVSGAVKKGIDNVLNFVKSMPRNIVNALGNLGNLLWDAGSKLISGFLDGIKSMWNNVKNTLSSLTDMLPSWKGPADRDAKLLTNSGRLIMQSLVSGFDQGKQGVKDSLQDLTSDIQRWQPPEVDARVNLLADMQDARIRRNQLAQQQPITVNVSTLKADANIGRVIVDAIEQYQLMGGRQIVA